MRRDFGIGAIDTIKVALTADQVNTLDLPPGLDAKKSSSRYKKFARKYGDKVHEVEAISPERLQAIVHSAVDSVIDTAAFNAGSTASALTLLFSTVPAVGRKSRCRDSARRATSMSKPPAPWTAPQRPSLPTVPRIRLFYHGPGSGRSSMLPSCDRSTDRACRGYLHVLRDGPPWSRWRLTLTRLEKGTL